MNVSRRGLHGAVAVTLAGVVLALSVAGPLMERADVGHRTVLESKHDPGRCGAHDHLLCTLLGAHHSAPTSAHAQLLAPAASVDRPSAASPSLSRSAYAADHPARAPPTV